MHTHAPLLATLFAILIFPNLALADCTTGDCIPGGGSKKTDCYSAFFGTGLSLNFPPDDPSKGKVKKKKELRCFDGDAGCDHDGLVNGSCRFNVDVCLYDDGDPNTCAPQDVVSAEVSTKKATQDGSGLNAAINALLPASSPACTSGEFIDVPVKVTNKGTKATKAKVKVKAQGANNKTDADTLKLTCIPRLWPSHGYDHKNTRATLQEDQIDPNNVANLTLKWAFPGESDDPIGPVTSTPTVGEKLVYATSWNGSIYALDRKKGKLKWSFDTGAAGGGIAPGLQSSATIAADGRVLLGDSDGKVWCFNGKNGKVLWSNQLGDPNVDHFWSSPTVATNRVYVGIASHSDQPCTQGRLVALDLDSGSKLWELKTVPDKICDNDTSISCAGDGECGGGSCIKARGAGVTATVAVNPTGEYVYMNVVGCFTFPSVGDSDSIFKINAATGDVIWKTRVDAPEQFGFCADDTTIECGVDGDCPTGTCTPKGAFHDFGFLNGPIIANSGDPNVGTLLVSGSKNATLYALDPNTGTIVWENAVQPKPISPGFAGFGLFNSALAYADGRFYASLYELIPDRVCANDNSVGCNADSDCECGGDPNCPAPETCLPLPDHAQAFDIADGSTAWTDDIGTSWGSLGYANGVAFMGSNSAFAFFAYDTATGVRKATIPLPGITTSGPSIVDGVLYIGHGLFGGNGVRAYELPD